MRCHLHFCGSARPLRLPLRTQGAHPSRRDDLQHSKRRAESCVAGSTNERWLSRHSGADISYHALCSSPTSRSRQLATTFFGSSLSVLGTLRREHEYKASNLQRCTRVHSCRRLSLAIAAPSSMCGGFAALHIHTLRASKRLRLDYGWPHRASLSLSTHAKSSACLRWPTRRCPATVSALTSEADAAFHGRAVCTFDSFWKTLERTPLHALMTLHPHRTSQEGKCQQNKYKDGIRDTSTNL
jgi:hypothetical protein